MCCSVTVHLHAPLTLLLPLPQSVPHSHVSHPMHLACPSHHGMHHLCRNLQKHFKRWLKETHQKEDKVMVLKGIADPEQQEEIRVRGEGIAV